LSFGNFLLSGIEIKCTNKMTEGTVPVPPDRPCAERDDDALPVQVVTQHFFGEHKAVGDETSVSINILNIFFEDYGIRL
jgi:hypothetical protein